MATIKNTQIDNQEPLSKEYPATEAMRNTIVLQAICDFLPQTDLLTMRQVNNTCLQIATPVFRTKATSLCIVDRFEKVSRQVLRRINQAELSDNPDPSLLDEKSIFLNFLESFHQLMQTSYSVPCTKFFLYARYLERMADNSGIERLLEIISYYATELAIWGWDVLFWQTPSASIYNLRYTKLKTLKITHCETRGDGLPRDHCYVVHIIQSAPQLDELSFQTTRFSDFIAGVFNSLELYQLRKLKHLTLDGEMPNQVFEKLLEAGVKLKTLTLQIHFPESTVQQKTFNAFLQIQVDSLEKLSLRLQSLDQDFVVFVPRLKTLKVLKIDADYHNVFPKLLSTQKYPALKRLRLELPQTDLQNVFDTELIPLDTVNTLVIPGHSRYYESRCNWKLENPVIMLKIAKMLPNVKCLSIEGKLDLMQIVNMEMKSIEELTLAIHCFDDLCQIMTGYTTEEIKKTEETLKQRGEFVPPVEEKEPLSCLQNVKRLQISTRFWLDSLCYLGPMKMQSLKCLDTECHFESYNNRKIHKRVVTEMRQKFEVKIYSHQICYREKCTRNVCGRY